MKVIVTGAKGQLGLELTKLLKPFSEIHPFDLDLDVTDCNKLNETFSQIKPDIVIHAAAMTDVDGCEINPDKAYAINDEGTKNVAKAAKDNNARMVYVSTDFVFDGSKETPYVESDEPNPMSTYGITKLAGEEHVRNLLDDYWIVRTSWIFGQGKNFVRVILNLAKKQGELSIVTDQVGSPTYALDLAEKIAELIQTDKYGLYHVSNQGQCSWFEFTKDILRTANIKGVKVKPTTTKDLGRPAPRPAFSVMDNAKLRENDFSLLRDYREALKDYLETHKEQ